jgi:hypothetical protein
MMAALIRKLNEGRLCARLAVGIPRQRDFEFGLAFPGNDPQITIRAQRCTEFHLDF